MWKATVHVNTHIRKEAKQQCSKMNSVQTRINYQKGRQAAIPVRTGWCLRVPSLALCLPRSSHEPHHCSARGLRLWALTLEMGKPRHREPAKVLQLWRARAGTSLGSIPNSILFWLSDRFFFKLKLIYNITFQVCSKVIQSHTVHTFFPQIFPIID